MTSSSKLPKRLSLDEIRELLGDKQAERLTAAFIRKKAGKIMRVTSEEVLCAKQTLDGETNDTKSLRKLAHKWIVESTKAKAAFARYLNQLLDGVGARPKPKGGRRVKTKR